MKTENIWKHPISTAIGIGMLLYCFYLIQTGRETITTALPLISFALYGLGKKDPNQGGGEQFDPATMPQLILILGAAATIGLSGCRTIRQSHTEVNKDSVSVVVRPREVKAKVEGASLDFTAALKCDSLGRVKFEEGWLAGLAQYMPNGNQVVEKKPFSLLVKNRNGSFAAMSIDSASGRMSITSGCDSLDRVIHAQDSVIKLMKFRSLISNKSVEKEVIPFWCWVVMIAGMISASLTLISWVRTRVSI